MTTQGTDYQQIHPALQKEINRYLKRGFRVVAQTPTTAQLVKPKQFSCLIATIATLLAILPLLIYLFWYAAQKDETVYLRMDGDRVRVTKG